MLASRYRAASPPGGGNPFVVTPTDLREKPCRPLISTLCISYPGPYCLRFRSLLLANSALCFSMPTVQRSGSKCKQQTISRSISQSWLARTGQRFASSGPYSDSTESELGFKWRVSEHTDLLMSDGHNVIVFATDLKVTSYVIHSRAYGDFAKLSGKCLPRASARVLREPSETNWKSYIAENASSI